MSDITQQGLVASHAKDGIATITFSHPAQNSLPGSLLAQLEEAIRQAGEDDSVQVVILKSGGDRTFCAGASFEELSAIDSLETGKQFFSGFARVINAMRKCPKFVLVAVQGKAVGGGVGLASAADYCLATKYAAVKLSELAVGIGPFVIGPVVARRIGEAAMSQLAIDATGWRDASWARDKGLYAEVFEDAEQLDAAVIQLAKRLADYYPEAMRELKRIFWEGTEYWDALLEERAAISGRLALSDFTKEAIAAFKAGSR